MMMYFFVTVVILLVLFAMIGIRIIFVKDGEFRGSCSSNNPFKERNPEARCSVCGAAPEDMCGKSTTSEDDQDDAPPAATSIGGKRHA